MGGGHRIEPTGHPAPPAGDVAKAVNGGRAGTVVQAGAIYGGVHQHPGRVAATLLGPEHADTLAARNNLAYWRGEDGDPAGAVEPLRELVGVQRRVLGPDHPVTLTTRGHLARRLGEAGDPAAAFEELLADRLRAEDPDDPLIRTTRSNLAYRRNALGR
ncbi:tetratricopeptide repeat protein [Saccharothrix australiensis]|uniref:Tetratricopeptide repeat protein n=1 Tax=Saccharothrix australiensis TaxID=2072 RepID=A0A495VZR4_9PSEU|nr:tetratricopeptide repeat protein [Saccharothrix australiensis]RKT54942.1 tetratricopeptide repeat protein [Saccharothrix australiensis]